MAGASKPMCSLLRFTNSRLIFWQNQWRYYVSPSIHCSSYFVSTILQMAHWYHHWRLPHPNHKNDIPTRMKLHRGRCGGVSHLNCRWCSSHFWRGFHHIASHPWQGLLAAVATGILQAVDQVRQAVPFFLIWGNVLVVDCCNPLVEQIFSQAVCNLDTMDTASRLNVSAVDWWGQS